MSALDCYLLLTTRLALLLREEEDWGLTDTLAEESLSTLALVSLLFMLGTAESLKTLPLLETVLSS